MAQLLQCENTSVRVYELKHRYLSRFRSSLRWDVGLLEKRDNTGAKGLPFTPILHYSAMPCAVKTGRYSVLVSEMSLPKLSVEVSEIDGMPVVHAYGEIDLYTVPEFDQALKDVVTRGTYAIIVDLTDISYLDSAGLSALLSAYRKLSARNAVMYVVAPPHSPGVRRALEITRLNMLMKVHDTLDSALRDLRMRQAA